MPGPAPKFDPSRRNSRVGPTRLPAEGRKGSAPPWPLSGQSDDEAQAWEELWSTPQAVAWERLGWVRTVARYCRVMVQAEGRAEVDDESGGIRWVSGTAAMHAQATSLEDRLGLTPKSLRMLLWEIASDEVAEKRQVSRGARGRIKAVG